MRYGAGVQTFGKDDGQGVLPLGGRGDVLPQLRRGGVVGCLPEVGCFLLLRQGFATNACCCACKVMCCCFRLWKRFEVV